MENEDTEYISGQGDDFITFIFKLSKIKENCEIRIGPSRKRCKDRTTSIHKTLSN